MLQDGKKSRQNARTDTAGTDASIRRVLLEIFVTRPASDAGCAPSAIMGDKRKQLEFLLQQSGIYSQVIGAPAA
jgi:hypothetical protein